MEFKFVVTPELQESIDDFKEMFRVMRNPKAVLEGFALFFSFAVMYFGLILIG